MAVLRTSHVELIWTTNAARRVRDWNCPGNSLPRDDWRVSRGRERPSPCPGLSASESGPRYSTYAGPAKFRCAGLNRAGNCSNNRPSASSFRRNFVCAICGEMDTAAPCGGCKALQGKNTVSDALASTSSASCSSDSASPSLAASLPSAEDTPGNILLKKPPLATTCSNSDENVLLTFSCASNIASRSLAARCAAPPPALPLLALPGRKRKYLHGR